jgi:hypothetical protein
MEQKRRFHMHMNVQNFLATKQRKDYEGIFSHDDGTVMTAREAKRALLGELAQGHVVIPVGECDNFDYLDKGCLGHEIS